MAWNIGDILATTLTKSEKVVKDNVFKKTALLTHLKENGGVKEVDGGATVSVPLMIGGTTPTWFTGSDTVSTTAADIVDAAKYDWAFVDVPVIVSYEEEKKNQGEAAIIDLVKSKVESAESNMAESINTKLFSGSTGSKEILGLATMVGTSGTIGGIDSSTVTQWRSYVESTAEALSVPKMRTGFNTASLGAGSSPTSIIVTTQTLHEKYESLATLVHQINVAPKAAESKRLADLGFGALEFKGAPVVFDEACTAGAMYFLNVKNYKLYTVKGAFMDMQDAVKPTNQHVTYKRLVSMVSAVTNRRASLAKLTAKTA